MICDLVLEDHKYIKCLVLPVYEFSLRQWISKDWIKAIYSNRTNFLKYCKETDFYRDLYYVTQYGDMELLKTVYAMNKKRNAENEIDLVYTISSLIFLQKFDMLKFISEQENYIFDCDNVIDLYDTSNEILEYILERAKEINDPLYEKNNDMIKIMVYRKDHRLIQKALDLGYNYDLDELLYEYKDEFDESSYYFISSYENRKRLKLDK